MKPHELKNGDTIPPIGFGTSHVGDDEDIVRVITDALDAGYRMIDTASSYRNEAGIGEALAKTQISREDLFITTKLDRNELGYESAFAGYEESLKQLGQSYVDLYLIHWPQNKQRIEAWQALAEMQSAGKVRHIGVSNFTVRHLEELREASDVVPEANQIELHPYVYEQQRPVLEYCREHGIAIQAHSPLVRGEALDDTLVGGIAGAYHKSPAQVLLRWAIQHNAIPLPRSSKLERMKENLNVFDFELSDEHMQALDGLSKNHRVVADPNELD